ncbi:MAG: type III-A CRISPR-associated protein Csm2 [Candidatus Omnitrophica bacterium]|nr:type III-A CRISPR-associated protein Csm2 [Candidatus Omnitrophota bacterium]
MRDLQNNFNREGEKLPNNYLSRGYFDSSGNLYEELVVSWAEEIAKNLGLAKPEMRKHQLRRFYNHIKNLERKLEISNEFDAINNDLKMLISYAVNAASSNPAKVPKIFEEFIRRNLSLVKDAKTFRGFLQHFQAIVGFSEKYLRKN